MQSLRLMCGHASSPLFFAARGRRSLVPAFAGINLAPRHQCRGTERREGAHPSPRLRGAARVMRRRARLAALRMRLFCPRRCASVGRFCCGRTRPERLPPPVAAPSSSHSRQPVLVPADGWTGPPGSGLRARSRAPRSRPPFGDPARDRCWRISATILHPACSIIETSRDDALSRARQCGI